MGDWEETDATDASGSVWPAVLVATLVLAVLGGIAMVVMRVTKRGEDQAGQQIEGGQQRRQAPRQQDRQERTGRGTATNRMQERLRRRRDAAVAAAETPEDRHDQEGLGGGSSGEEDEAEAGNRVDNRAPQGAPNTHRVTKQQAYDDRRRAKDDAREAEEEALAAEIARLDKARVAEQDAEAAKWMGQIKLEGQGTGEEAASHAQAQVEDLLAFMKQHKTVALNDLAAQFNMRTQDVITKIGGLEADGRLTGVMDDRGKFIYISPSEMEAVAAFVHQRGRVAIAELAARSDELIDLERKLEAGDVDAAAAQELFGEESSPSVVAVS